MHFLDTDICIYLLERRLPAVEARLRELPLDEIGTTAVTAGELRYAALHSAHPVENLARIESFLSPLRPVPFDDTASKHFAAIKQTLARHGTPIGPMDMLIAATVLAVHGVLVTNNVREFSRVPGLQVESWV